MRHTDTGKNEDEYARRTWPQRAVAGENPAPPPSPKMTSEPRAETTKLVLVVGVGDTG